MSNDNPRPDNGRRAAAHPLTDAATFASEAELRALNAAIAGFGLRSPGSPNHERAIDWAEGELRAIPGLEVRSDPYELTRWQPLSAAGDPGDLVDAGALRVEGRGDIAIAAAAPFSKPTDEVGVGGELVWIAADTPITAASARGKVVVRPITSPAIPYLFINVLAHHATDDFPLTGSYGRPFTAPLDADLVAAGIAGAAGVVFVFDAPREQIEGYFDPHEGTLYHLPALFVGRSEGETLRQLAEVRRRASVVVRARIDRTTTRNLSATLRGRNRERIVVNTHSDGATWVQENGLAGVIALARHLAQRPVDERPRDIEFSVASAHLSYAFDGNKLVANQLSADFDRGTVACSISVEHLGTREILPVADGSLRPTGLGEPLFWNVGPSRALTRASIEAVRRRGLDRTVVVPGSDLPVPNRIPQHCYMGGIGTFIHMALVPTVGLISGPWSLWAPSFGEDAIDFARMRRQLLAIGDVVLGMGSVPLTEIVGDYPALRRRVAEGAKLAPQIAPPRVAPVSESEMADGNAPHTAIAASFGKGAGRPRLPLSFIVHGIARLVGRLVRRLVKRGDRPTTGLHR